MIDCHVHTVRCGHAQGSAADYVAAARQKGVDVLTFTEHLPIPAELDPRHEYTMAESELDPYLAEIRALAEESRKSGASPRIFVGIEADWLPDAPDHARGLLSAHEFDLVLGSVHFLGDWAFDDPSLFERWDSADVDATWRRYFELFSDAASSGLFDVMAHPDLVKKFGHRPSFDPALLFAGAADLLANKGVAIEVSTAGLRKPVGELYPSSDFLAACARAGVPATIGSDAHRPDEVGFAFEVARSALLEAGYDHAVYFERRKQKEYPL